MASRAFFLLLSKLVPLIVQLLIIFIFSRRLSYDDYGKYQSIWLYMNVLSAIGLFGLPALLLSTSFTNIIYWMKENKRTVVPIFLLLNLLPIVYIFTIAQYLGGITSFLLLATIIAQNISIITEALAVKNEREKNVVAANVIFAVLFLALHLFVLDNGYSLIKLLPGLMAIYLLKALLLFNIKHFQTGNAASLKFINNTGKQWFYLGINDIVGMLFKWLDKWVILLLLTSAQFAIYFNGAYEVPVFGLMISAAGSIMLVELSKDNTTIAEQATQIFKSTSLLLASIVFPSFCFLLFYNQEFFLLFFGAKYEASIPIFLVSIFILPVRIINYTAVLQVLHRNDLVVKGALIDIVAAILLMLILYPLLQERGIALAFVISTYVQVGYYLFQTGKLINKKLFDFFPIKQLLLIMLFSIVIMLASKYALILLSSTYKLMAGILICIVAILLLILYHLKMAKKNY